jgi:hypothetical protein
MLKPTHVRCPARAAFRPAQVVGGGSTQLRHRLASIVFTKPTTPRPLLHPKQDVGLGAGKRLGGTVAARQCRGAPV